MATRFYFRASATPAVSPAFHASWDVTGGATRRQMSTTKLAGDTVTSVSNSGSLSQDVLIVQLVSDPMASGISIPDASDIEGWSYFLEASGSNNAITAAAVRVFSQDGTTVRSELSGVVHGSGGEFPFTGFPARARDFMSGSTVGGSAYTTVAGDRLVVEVGHFNTALSGSPNASMRIGSDATGSDAPEDQNNESLTALGWFEFEPNVTFLADVTAPGGEERGLRIGVNAVIGWEIDGRPVEFTNDWQAEVQTGWGDRTLTASFGTDVTWAEQGSSVVGWKRSGEPLWQGTLVVDPRKDGDHYRIRAHGYADQMAENSTRLFYRTDGAEQWEDRGSDPYGYNQNEKYDLHQGRGSLQWKFGNNADAFATNDAAGFALWKEGGLISRYTATLTVNQALGGFDFLSRSFTGPDGTQSDITTQTLNFGGPLTLDVDTTINVANQEDGMTFVVIRTGASSTPNGRRRLGVTRIKVYGRTTDAAFSASDAVADVAALSGLGTDGIDSNPLVVLPIDWTDDHPGFCDYMAELVDWRWMVRGTEIDLRPLRAHLGKRHRGRRGPQPRAGAPRQPLPPALSRPERRPADGGGGTGGGPVPRPGDRRVRRGAGGPPNRFGSRHGGRRGGGRVRGQRPGIRRGRAHRGPLHRVGVLALRRERRGSAPADGPGAALRASADRGDHVPPRRPRHGHARIGVQPRGDPSRTRAATPEAAPQAPRRRRRAGSLNVSDGRGTLRL